MLGILKYKSIMSCNYFQHACRMILINAPTVSEEDVSLHLDKLKSHFNYGPILFLLFTNSDDVKLFITYTSADERCLLQTDLNNLIAW